MPPSLTKWLEEDHLDGTQMGRPAALTANRAKSHIDDQVAKMWAEARRDRCVR